LNDKLIKHAEEILTQLKIKASLGRPRIELDRGLNGIFFVLRTGIQWNGLPRCFGSYSAVHRLFQKLKEVGFFERLWHRELQEYDAKHRLSLEVQAGDCSHIKAPLGQEKTGKSPVDRRKLGTKRSIIVDKNGIVIGCSLGAGNRHDSTLFEASIRSIPSFLNQPRYKEMHLDSAYDSKHINVLLFNYYYVPKISKNKRNAKQLISYKTEKKRWIVESAHSWMNRFRRLLVRFEKSASNYFAFMQFSFSIITFNKLRI
jgi:transposase